MGKNLNLTFSRVRGREVPYLVAKFDRVKGRLSKFTVGREAMASESAVSPTRLILKQSSNIVGGIEISE